VKVYPVNVKLLSGAISPLSYSALIIAGTVHVTSAAFQLNDIVYVIGLNSPVKLHAVVTVAPQSVNHQEKTYHSLAIPVATTVHEIVTLPAPSSREIEVHSSTSILHVLILPCPEPVKVMIKVEGADFT